MIKKICPNCLYVGSPKTVTKGSLLIELILWICFIIPGVIYSLWRITSRYKACPTCGAPNMIPADSPHGEELLEHIKSIESTHPEKAQERKLKAARNRKTEMYQIYFIVAILIVFAILLWLHKHK